MTSSAPFEYLAHLLTVPVRVAGVDARFVLDTGIGVSLISASLASRVGCAPDGTAFTGRRMSGTAVTIPLARLTSLHVGGHQWRDAPVGIFDMQAMAGLDGVEGFLSLTCFVDTAVTVDYQAGQIIVEDQAPLARRAAGGTPVPAEVRKDGCSVRRLPAACPASPLTALRGRVHPLGPIRCRQGHRTYGGRDDNKDHPRPRRRSRRRPC